MASKCALIFYYLYAEIALELFLMALWITSFAGIASYIQQMSLIVGFIKSYADGNWGNTNAAGQAANSQTSYYYCIAISILGAIIFVFALANFLFLVAFAVHKANGRVARSIRDVEPMQEVEPGYVQAGNRTLIQPRE